MADLPTLTVRIKKRWWARILLAAAPRVLPLVHRVSLNAAVAGLNLTARLLGPLAFAVTVVTRRRPQPMSTR